ncbi:8-oxo-dGTP diphosphatase [Paenibacillus ferrarius]|uniref:8-oxo-dGTP diphosphatase n=1 Tax=Paenibacillus ferrarius TaxID=1469647 RepID=UPI003D2E256A
MSSVELTNMCMIYDRATDRVLVQERVKSWKGVAFPGGHIEDGESIIDSTIREIKEETGLTVSNLELCGIIYWYDEVTKDKYFVFSYRTEVFSGELLTETDEGRLYWVSKEELASLPFAKGFKERLPMFLDKAFSEGFIVTGPDGRSEIKWQ